MTPTDRIPSSPILRARQKRKWTQAKLAGEVGTSASYVAMLEREPRLLRRRMAERLAAVLGVSVDELLPVEQGP